MKVKFFIMKTLENVVNYTAVGFTLKQLNNANIYDKCHLFGL